MEFYVIIAEIQYCINNIDKRRNKSKESYGQCIWYIAVEVSLLRDFIQTIECVVAVFFIKRSTIRKEADFRTKMIVSPLIDLESFLKH